tara:strand:+ start:562 stop:1029 length:468 start_codon:yes stop_codon:yes gene_type:complete
MANKKEALNADKQMHEIIESLEKMKSAAEMLANAERDTTTITETAKDIVEKVSPFIDSGNKVLSSLEDYDVKKEVADLDKKIDSLKTQLSSNRARTGELFKSSEKINSKKFADLTKKINQSDKKINKKIDEKSSNLLGWLFVGAIALLSIAQCSG